MLKALALPKGAKEELDFPVELAEKVINGEPLWEDNKKGDDDDEDGEFQNDQKEEKMTDE